MKGRGLRLHPARRAAFIAGARAVMPSLPAMAVWGVVTGVAMMKLGLALAPALGMTFIVSSGASQLTVLPLMAGSTAVLTLVLAAALAGLRFVVYSAVLSRHLSRVPLPLRLGTCFLTIDGPLAVLTQAQARGPLVQRVTLLNGANIVTALVWSRARCSASRWPRCCRWAPSRATWPCWRCWPSPCRCWWAGRLGRRRGQHRGDAAGRELAAQLGTFAAVLAGVAAALWASPQPRKD